MDGETKKYSFLGLEIGRIGWWGSLLAFVATPVLVLPYVIWFWAVNGRALSDDPERWAQFGDYLAGTAGPLIGFASIMLLVATLQLQRMELKEQREQLKLSIGEAEKHNSILIVQAFEQSFFTWLRDYKSQLNEVSIDPHATVRISAPHFSSYESTLTGSKALARIANLLGAYHDNELYIQARPSPLTPLSDEEHKSITEKLKGAVAKTWGAIYNDDDGALRSAIRTLYGLIRWIDRHGSLTTDDKLHYTGIVKARLTEAEMLILFSNGLTERGAKLYELLIKYDMLSEFRPERHYVLRNIGYLTAGTMRQS